MKRANDFLSSDTDVDASPDVVSEFLSHSPCDGAECTVESYLREPSVPGESECNDEGTICDAQDDYCTRDDKGSPAFGGKSRGMCITIFHECLDHVRAKFRDYFDVTDHLTYSIVGIETCPETKRKHAQCYIHFKNPRYLHAVRKDLGLGGHFTCARGSPAQNKTYCSKEGDWEEWGMLPQAGRRTDISTLAQRVVEERVSLQSLAACADYDGLSTWLKYNRAFGELRSVTSGCRSSAVEPTVVWCWGATGTGKSRWAHDKYPTAYRYPGEGYWFDGYTGQITIIFDDFRPMSSQEKGSGISFVNVLRLTDRYPLKVPVKGGFVDLLATEFIFTTPKPPEETFATHEHLDQLMRRISLVKQFGDDNMQPKLKLS